MQLLAQDAAIITKQLHCRPRPFRNCKVNGGEHESLLTANIAQWTHKWIWGKRELGGNSHSVEIEANGLKLPWWMESVRVVWTTQLCKGEETIAAHALRAMTFLEENPLRGMMAGCPCTFPRANLTPFDKGGASGLAAHISGRWSRAGLQPPVCDARNYFSRALDNMRTTSQNHELINRNFLFRFLLHCICWKFRNASCGCWISLLWCRCAVMESWYHGIVPYCSPFLYLLLRFYFSNLIFAKSPACFWLTKFNLQ